jgi:hypothetical protein
LTEFWNLTREDFDSLQWWNGCRAQFLQLCRLVRDIFSIPGILSLSNNLLLGSAVAVERIFSGGEDIITLCRASLKPETFGILMMVKMKLIIAREMPIPMPQFQVN